MDPDADEDNASPEQDKNADGVSAAGAAAANANAGSDSPDNSDTTADGPTAAASGDTATAAGGEGEGSRPSSKTSQRTKKKKKLTAEVKAQILYVQGDLEDKLQNILEMEEYLTESLHVTEERDEEEAALLREVGLFSGVDVPEPSLPVDIDQGLLHDHDLIDLQDIVGTNEKKIVDSSLPKIHRAPPVAATRTHRKTRSKTSSMSMRDILRDKDDEDLEGKEEAEIRAIREKRKKRKAQKKRAYLLRTMMPARDIDENKALLHKMQKKLNYLRNPRFQTPAVNTFSRTQAPSFSGNRKFKRTRSTDRDATFAPLKVTAASGDKPQDAFFVAEPNYVMFEQYEAGGEYGMEVSLRNVSTISRRVRIVPPASEFFSASPPVFKTQSGMVAPGMSCVVLVRFRPDSLADYQDSFTMCCENGKVKIDLIARRVRPELSLPKLLKCGPCMVDDTAIINFPCLNTGNPGRFWLLPATDYNNRSTLDVSTSIPTRENAFTVSPVEDRDGAAYIDTFTHPSHCTQKDLRDLDSRPQTDALEMGPFIIRPAEFYLHTNEDVQVEITFNPTKAALFNRKFLLLCDNTQIFSFEVRGQGWDIYLKIADGRFTVPTRALATTEQGDENQDSSNSENDHYHNKTSITSNNGARKKKGSGKRSILPPSKPKPKARSSAKSRGKLSARSRYNTSTKSSSSSRPSSTKTKTRALSRGLQSPASQDSSALPFSQPGVDTGIIDNSASDLDSDQQHLHEGVVGGGLGAELANMIVFNDLTIQGRATRVFVVTNTSPLPLNYNWTSEMLPEWFPTQRVLTQDSLSVSHLKDQVFGVQPSYGTFQPFQAIEFTFTFAPVEAALYRAEYVINLQQLPSTNLLKSPLTMHDYNKDSNSSSNSGHNHTNQTDSSDGSGHVRSVVPIERGTKSDIPFQRFTLQGRGIGCQAVLDPPVILFGKPLLLGVEYKRTIRLLNPSQAATSYKWGSASLMDKKSGSGAGLERSHKSSSTEQQTQLTLDEIDLSLTPVDGVLGAVRSKTITVTLKPTALGEIHMQIPCSISHGNGQMLKVHAVVQGPSLRIIDPLIDFELLNFGDPSVKAHKYLNFENSSSSPAYFSFCQAGFTPPPFPHDSSSSLSLSSSSSLPPLLANGTKGVSTSTDNGAGALLSFAPATGVVPPNSKGHVLVTFSPRESHRLRTHIECHVMHGDTQFVSARAEVQAPKVCLFPTHINIDEYTGSVASVSAVLQRKEKKHALQPLATSEIALQPPTRPKLASWMFATVPRTNFVTVKNLTNLPAVFQWHDHLESDYQATFYPRTGKIEGHGELQVKMKLVVYNPGSFKGVFGCDIEGYDLPLGVRVSATVRPLEVSYHLVDDEKDKQRKKEEDQERKDKNNNNKAEKGAAEGESDGNSSGGSDGNEDESKEGKDRKKKSSQPRSLFEIKNAVETMTSQMSTIPTDPKQLAIHPLASLLPASQYSSSTTVMSLSGQSRNWKRKPSVDSAHEVKETIKNDLFTEQILQKQIDVLDTAYPVTSTNLHPTYGNAGAVDSLNRFNNTERSVSFPSGAFHSSQQHSSYRRSNPPTSVSTASSSISSSPPPPMQLDFGDQRIFKKSVMQFVIRNHTAIPTSFSFNFDNLGIRNDVDVDMDLAFADDDTSTLPSTTARTCRSKRRTQRTTLRSRGDVTTATESLVEAPASKGPFRSTVIHTLTSAAEEINKRKALFAAEANITGASMGSSLGNKRSIATGSTAMVSLPRSIKSRASRRSKATNRTMSTDRYSAGGGMLASKKVKRKVVVKLSHSVLGSGHERTMRFSSVHGQQHVANKERQEKEKTYLHAGQGVAFLVYPSSGTLAPYSCVSVGVVCFNDMCGEYTDRLLCNIQGLPTLHVPVKVSVVGSPISFSRSNPGMNFGDRYEALDMHQISAGGAVVPLSAKQMRAQKKDKATTAKMKAEAAAQGLARISLSWQTQPTRSQLSRQHRKTIIVDNTGPLDIKLDWRLFDLSKIEVDRMVDVQIKLKQIADPDAPPALATDIVHHQYPEADPDFVFSVQPKTMVVPAYSNGKCVISFNANVDDDTLLQIAEQFEGFMQARMHVKEEDLLKITTSSATDRYDTNAGAFLQETDRHLTGTSGASVDTIANNVFTNMSVSYTANAGTTVDTAPNARSTSIMDMSDDDSDDDLIQEDPVEMIKRKKLSSTMDSIDQFEMSLVTMRSSRRGIEYQNFSSSSSSSSSLGKNGVSSLDLSKVKSRGLGLSHRSNRDGKSKLTTKIINPLGEKHRWLPAPHSLRKNPLRLYLSADTILPHLTVEKKKRPDGKKALRFTVTPQPRSGWPKRFKDEEITSMNYSDIKRLGLESQYHSISRSLGDGKATEKKEPALLVWACAECDTHNSGGRPLCRKCQAPKQLDREIKPKVDQDIAGAQTLDDLLVGVDGRDHVMAGPMKDLPLTNRSNATLKFSLTTEPANLFHAVSAASSALRLSSGADQDRVSMNRLEGLRLLPGENLMVAVKFVVPSPSLPSYLNIWPLQELTHVHGKLHVDYDNGARQTVDLVTTLHRPQIKIQPSFFDFGLVHVVDPDDDDKESMAMRALDLGATVRAFNNKMSRPVVTNAQEISRFVIHINNASLADASWRLIHVPKRKCKQRSTMDPRTLNEWANKEFDTDGEAIDDPDVFEFDCTRGVVQSGAGHMPNIGYAAYESRLDEKVREKESFSIEVVFRPKERGLYASRFQFVVDQGAGMPDQPNLMLTLTGGGSYDEDDDVDVDLDGYMDV